MTKQRKSRPPKSRPPLIKNEVLPHGPIKPRRGRAPFEFDPDIKLSTVVDRARYWRGHPSAIIETVWQSRRGAEATKDPLDARLIDAAERVVMDAAMVEHYYGQGRLDLALQMAMRGWDSVHQLTVLDNERPIASELERRKPFDTRRKELHDRDQRIQELSEKLLAAGAKSKTERARQISKKLAARGLVLTPGRIRRILKK